MITSQLYGVFLLLFTAAAVRKESFSLKNKTENGDQNSTGTHSELTCLTQCDCHLEDDALFIRCVPVDTQKASYNSSIISVYETLESGTNDTLSPTVQATYEGGDLPDLLLTISVNRIYVTRFQGDAIALWDYLSKLNSGLHGLYLKESVIVLKEDQTVLQNFSHLDMENVEFITDGNNSKLSVTFPSVDSISITKSNISMIMEDTFGKVDHLRAINLSGNKMRTFNGILQANNTHIISLNISHNWLYSPLIGCNQVLTNLTDLDISFNQINSLKKAFCSKGLQKLQSLDLSHNVIEVLENGCFDELRGLRILDLHSNSIVQMNFACFACGLSALHSLSLQHNNLTNLDLEVLTPLAGLQKLNLSYNQILNVGRQRDGRLNISLCEVPQTNLQQLPQQQPFSDSPDFWPHLELLDLTHNNISMINQQHFDEFFKNVKYLLLGNNYINYVPRYGIEHLHRLETIDLSHNVIDWMDVGTFTNPHLRDIDLSHNKLKKIISMTFLYLPNLIRLDLSHNRLNYLYRLSLYKTCNHDQLMHLHLNHNKLTEDAIWKFMSTFREMKSDNCLLLIHFQNNRMRYLLDSSSREIFKHALRESSPDFIHMWSHSYFNMSLNPFHCDCQFHKDLSLIQHINQDVFTQTGNANSLFRWQYMECEKPSNLKGISMQRAQLILDKTCMANVVDHVKQRQIECNKLTSVSLQEMGGTPCQQVQINQTSFVTATTVAVLCTLLGLVAIICVLKKTGVIPKFQHRGKWYKVYMEDDTTNLANITLHYHKNDRSLVTSELVYFVQDCCPVHDIVLQPSDNIGEMMEQPMGESITNLFIVSVDLMHEIRCNTGLQSHYETIIEQSQVSVFLIMGNRMDIEALYPTFWAKVKYRHNVYFVCGTDRLPKLQCVLKNTSCDVNHHANVF